MSLKKVEEVKKDRGFKPFDLIIYGVVLIIVATLFISIFATRNKDPLTGVKISVAAEVVFEYEFGGEVPKDTDRVKVEEDDKGITVTVHTDDGGTNTVYIDKTAKTAKMTEANCRGRQCLYFAAIKSNSTVIYCNPHRLKIEPLYRDIDNPNIIF